MYYCLLVMPLMFFYYYITATSGVEMLICVLTFPVCCRMAAKVKEEVRTIQKIIANKI